jgi:hypothetical protein
MRVVLFILLFSSTAFAKKWSFGVLPFVGFNKGYWSTSYEGTTENATINGDVVGVDYGAKILAKWRFFFMGVDYRMSSHSWKYNSSDDFSGDDNWADTSAAQTQIGLTGGLQITKTSFFWISYFLKNEVELDANIDPDFAAPIYSGTGLTFGVSLVQSKRFFLTGEYSIQSFDEMDLAGTAVSIPGATGGVTYGAYEFKTLTLTVGIFLGKLRK